MASIGRVDQAVLLLRQRLERLDAQRTKGGSRTDGAKRPDIVDPLRAARALGDRGPFTAAEIRRAFVRTLLADALGPSLVTSLEFQALSDQVADILEGSEAGRDLLARALQELD